MRAYMRRINLGEEKDESIARAVGLSGQEMEDMFRLLAIAKIEDRFVVPTAARAEAEALSDSHPMDAIDQGCPVGEVTEPRVMLNLSPTRRSS